MSILGTDDRCRVAISLSFSIRSKPSSSLYVLDHFNRGHPITPAFGHPTSSVCGHPPFSSGGHPANWPVGAGHPCFARLFCLWTPGKLGRRGRVPGFCRAGLPAWRYGGCPRFLPGKVGVSFRLTWEGGCPRFCFLRRVGVHNSPSPGQVGFHFHVICRPKGRHVNGPATIRARGPGYTGWVAMGRNASQASGSSRLSIS